MGIIANLMIKIGAETSQAVSGFNQLNATARSSMGGVQSSTAGVSNSFGLLAKGVGLVSGVMAGTFGAAIKAGVDYNATLESSKVAWTTLLGSQEKAGKMLSDIEKFAANTPFEKMGVDKMAKYLNNAGFEGDALFSQLTKFGDLGGAFNVPAAGLEEMVRQYSQVKQAGVAYTEDLNILQDQGIPIFGALSKVLGISTGDVKKWASEGKISAEIYQKALDQVSTGVAGGMAAQSQTFNGMISTFKDGIGQILGILSQDIFLGLKDGLAKALEKMNEFTSVLQSGGLAEAMKTLLPEGIVDGFIILGNGIKGALGWIIDNKDLLIAAVVGLTTAFALHKAMVVGAMIVQEAYNLFMLICAASTGGYAGAQTFLAGATGATTLATWALNAALAVLTAPVTLIILAIVAFAAAIIYLWNTNEGFRNAVIAIFNGIATFIVQVINLIVAIVMAFGQTFVNLWNAMAKGVSAAMQGLGTFIVQVINLIVAIVMAFGQTFTNLWNALGQMLVNLWNSIKTNATNAWNGICKVVTDIITTVKTAIDGAVNFIKGINLFDVGTNMIQGLINGIKNMAANVVAAAKGVVGDAVSAAKNLLGIKSPSRVFMEIGGNVGQGLAIGVNKTQGLVKDSMVGLSKTATGSFNASVNPDQPAVSGSGQNQGGGLTIHIENFVNNTDKDLENIITEINWLMNKKDVQGGIVYA